MKNYKVFIFVAVFLSAAIGMQSAAHASLCLPENGENFTSDLNPVSLLLFDLDHSGQATLSTSTVSFSGSSLEYSTDGSTWNTFNAPATIDFGDSNTAQILLRLNSGSNFDQDGQITYLNYDAAASTSNAMDLYHSFFVMWDTEPVDITIGSTDDRFAATPIPASALLLFTGLIGLVSFRRRMADR